MLLIILNFLTKLQKSKSGKTDKKLLQDFRDFYNTQMLDFIDSEEILLVLSANPLLVQLSQQLGISRLDLQILLTYTESNSLLDMFQAIVKHRKKRDLDFLTK